MNLVQTMNFEFETISISSSSFPGVEMTIGNVTFNSTIDFLSPSQNLADPLYHGKSTKRFSMAATGDLLPGRTDVAISLAVDISDIVGKATIFLPQGFDRRFSELTDMDNETVFLHAPGTLHSKLDFSYDLSTRELSPNTVVTSIHAPQCDIFLDRIMLLLSSAPKDDSPSPSPAMGSVYEHNRKPTQLSYTNALKSINVQMERVNIIHHKSSNYVHLLEIKNLGFDVWPSDGSSSSVHREWLGLKDRGFTLGLALRIDHVRVDRYCPETATLVHCLLVISRVNVDTICYQWPSIWTFTPNCPAPISDPLVVWQISLGDVHVVERFCAFMTELDVSKNHELPNDLPKKQYQTIMPPNVQFDLYCQSFCVDLHDGKNILSSDFTCSLATSDINIHADINTTPAISFSENPSQYNFLGVNLRYTNGPIHITPCLKSNSLGAVGHEAMVKIDCVLVSVASYIATSHDIPTETMTVHPEDSIIHFKVLVDNVLFDMWRKDTTLLLRSLMRVLPASKSEAQRNSTHPLLFNYSFHVGIHHTALTLTGPDINPNCDLELSRGLELGGASTLQIVKLRRPSDYLEFFKKFLNQELVKHAQWEIDESSDIQAYSCAFWNITLFPITANSFEYGRNTSSRGDGTDYPLLYIPSVCFISFPIDQPVIVRVTSYETTIQSHIDFLGVYSILLAHQTFQECFRFSKTSVDKPSASSPLLPVIFKIQIHALSIRCNLPLKREVFLRAEGILITKSPALPPSLLVISIEACVPNSKKPEEWDNILTLSQTTVQVPQSTEQKLAVTVQGLRFSIPHGFIFSGLLVDLTVAFKALRHLWANVQRGHHIPFPAPFAETAKSLPDVSIHIKCLVFEVMDNPLDGKIGRISRVGPMAQRLRSERERAFRAKVRNLRMETEAETDDVLQDEYPFVFTSKRTVSIADARDRLNRVHAISWYKAISREEDKESLLHESVLRALGQVRDDLRLLPIVIRTPAKIPPLFRAMFNGFNLRISACKENAQTDLPSELGNMPKSAQYTLFVSFHMRCTLDSARIVIRDYPLPLFNLPVTPGRSGLKIDTDIVIAEELGPPESVEWILCPIIPDESTVTNGYFLNVPKTIMPVKSYADLKLKLYSAVAEFTWGISYSPAIQDFLRIIETLTPTSSDPSPPIGFWDKLRLILHWRMTAKFDGTACLHFKGSHDPYQISGPSTGFDFKWDENVILRVNHKNAERELIELVSDTMTIIIPCSKSLLRLNKALHDDISMQWDPSISWCLDEHEKLCAKFSNGIRWGIGFVLERTCNPTVCNSCHGDTFNRSCRFFTFSPHHKVVLRKPRTNSHEPVDSYYGFRSNFIHLSTSLVSPLRGNVNEPRAAFHLTPKTFTHFWSWWSLFDDGISLPIRQGSIFPEFRLPTQKFSQHLATIKYRIEFSSIYIAHTYKLDTEEDQKMGLTRCIGIKTSTSFQVDLHQRLEEKPRSKNQKQKSKVVRHRPFYAIDVILTGLDLRSLMATFVESDNRTSDLDINFNSHKFLSTFTPCSPSSDWINMDDFKETDWETPRTKPTVYLYETAYCPKFVYFKRVPTDLVSNTNTVKFGDEATHVCLMGKEPSVQEVQLQFGIERLLDLKTELIKQEQNAEAHANMSNGTQNTDIRQMISLLEEYVQHSSATLNRASQRSSNYIPANIVLPEEIQRFVNVYQVHCPVVYFSNATRDILHEYYAASRARRGFEYHLSARAVKFIRDQEHEVPTEDPVSHRSRSGSASIAAKAVKRMMVRENREDGFKECDNSLIGWEHGISEQKAHLCLLLKPQVVLRSTHSETSTLLLAADHVVLRNHGIVDDANIDDPVSGHIMRRNFANINGLQLFQPLKPTSTASLPFEVFLDIRSDSREFKRIVPQTYATLRYDSFNKLRLRNNVTTLSSTLNENQGAVDHLLYEMDLLAVEVPRFSVTADASAFAAISSIVNDLLLFSDPARKARSLQLETMIFGYDFDNYRSAAKVVSDLQSRLRWRLLLDEFYRTQWVHESKPCKEVMDNKMYILKLSEELNMIFDAFKLAQIKTDDRSHDKKSALRLHTSSSDISWRMLDNNRELLAKVAVRGIDFSWLSRQDSSTTSVIQVEDLQAFDGSPNALWPEVLTKYNEPLNHHMMKQGLFMKGQWSVLAPVGGISIYSDFKIELHPIRLTLETQLGNKILAYILPNRHNGDETHSVSDRDPGNDPVNVTEDSLLSAPSTRSNRSSLTSRSLSNLTQTYFESPQSEYHAPGLPKSRSSTALVAVRTTTSKAEAHATNTTGAKNDLSEMQQRSNQKTFVLAEIPSVHVLLSIVKNGGFLIRDARLRTHDLEWRNRTLSVRKLRLFSLSR